MAAIHQHQPVNPPPYAPAAQQPNFNLAHLVDDVFTHEPARQPTATRSALGNQPIEAVGYYAVPVETDQLTKARMILQLAKYVDGENILTDDGQAWFWTLVDIALPGVPLHVFRNDPTVIGRLTPMSADLINYIAFGDIPPIRGQDGVPLDPQPAGPRRDPVVPLFPGFVWSADLDRDVDWLQAVNLVGVVMWAIGKAPNANNVTAFANRFTAGQRKLGVADNDEAAILATDLPALRTYRFVNGYFNVRARSRFELCLVLISWVGDLNNTREKNVIVTHIKLWKKQGLTHVEMIRHLVNSYSPALRRLTFLHGEVNRFINDYRLFKESNLPNKAYIKVLRGDTDNIMPSRDYAELLKLARRIYTLIDQRFELYAPQLPDTQFWTAFEAAVRETGGSLPAGQVAGMVAPEAAVHAIQ